MSNVKVFISHTHADRKLAEALRDALSSVFGRQSAQVQFSSDQSLGGGIPAGTNWLEWIHQQVVESDVALVLLTPRSVEKPWLMWEAGAVTGAARSKGSALPIVPILYRLSGEEIPSPLRALNAVHGDAQEGILRTLQVIQTKLNVLEQDQFTTLANIAVGAYLPSVEKCLKAVPPPMTEAAVSEWCARIDAFRAAGRSGEVEHVHRALLYAFGQDPAKPVPLDMRIHRRLGEMYLESSRADKAAIEFELALRLSPNDIYLLHQLGLAQLNQGNRGLAKGTLERILEIDSTAPDWNPEVAGLKGRLHREEWKATKSIDELRAARDSYAKALKSDPTSYYMADNVGQLSFLLGEREAALEAFKKAKSAAEGTPKPNVWSLATLANANLILGNREEALEALRRIRSLGATARELESIAGGLERLKDSNNASEDDVLACRNALQGR